VSEREKAVAVESLFAGDSEMARLMRAHDWSQTRLGDISGWAPSLKTTVSVCLNSRFPMVIWWGKELVLLYNDAWRPILGTKHPKALGRPGQEVWSEIWDVIGVQLNSVLETAQATWSDDMLLLVDRYGYTEEAYFTYSYSPIFLESGEVGGAFTAVTETTRRVIGERRLSTLRELAASTVEAKSVEATCRIASATLANNPYDVPFALLYLVEQDGKQACLVETVRVEKETSVSPEWVDLNQAEGCWQFERVRNTGDAEIIDDLITRFGVLTGGVWDDPVRSAIVLPIAQAGQKHLLAGFLVLGISPRREFDDEYRGFFDLVASNVVTAIANAQAYEEERKRAEALAELDRAKTAFFSNVSHEFRTPLTLMLSPLEELSISLSERLQPDEREQLQLIQRNGLRLQKLVNTLLDFSRIEAGRVQASYEPTDLAVYTSELASVFRSLIERAGMSLVIDCSVLPKPVYVDREMWEKIVLNLISNAFKFTFDGSITVRLKSVDNSVELSVTDTGVGVPKAELPRLFERFYRLSKTRSRTYEGSGIGLALVQELVKLHGGTIRVTSQVERGTTFAIAIPFGTAHLPPDRIEATRTLTSTALGVNSYVVEASRWIADAASEQNEAITSESLLAVSTRSKQSSTPTARILLADDNADMRDYVKRLLSQYWNVETVGDGFAALETIAQRPPDLVLSDVMMPRLDGFGLLRELRCDPTTQNIPVILLSARAGEEARIKGLEAGADDYLTKPFSARELLARVESNLKLAQLRKVAAQQEQALRLEVQAAKDSLENVLTRISDQFLALDREWHYTYVNERVIEVTGIAREDLLGRSVWELFPDLIGTQFYIEIHRAVAEQTPVQFEYFYARWNRWFNNRVYPSADGVSMIATEITARKQAEEQLRESEKFLKAINETAPNLLYIFDLNERRNVYVSPQIFPMLGVLPADVQVLDSQILVELFHPDDLEQIEQHHDRIRAAREDNIFTIEYRMKHSSGKWLWLSSRDTIFVRDDRGKPTQILGSAIDITDRKQAELLLSEQKRLLELIAIGTPLDNCLAAVCTSVSKLNPSVRACILLSDAQRRTFPRSITPNFPPSFGQGLKDAPINELAIGTCGTAVYCGEPVICTDIAHDDRWSQEWRELCVAHGILACHSTPILGIDNLPLGSLMLCFDEARMPINWEYQLSDFGTHVASIAFERDRSSLALRESEAKLRLFIEQAPASVAMFDRQMCYLTVSQRWVDEYHLGSIEVTIGRSHYDLFPNLPDRWRQVYQRCLAGAIEKCDEDWFVLPDGSEQWLRWEINPWYDSTGAVGGILIFAENITERKLAEAEREQLLAREQAAREAAENANRIKDEFLAVLSHELRSPLNPILGWSKLLQQGKLDATKTQIGLAAIDRNVQLQAQLIDDLLDISRILRGKLSLNQMPVDLRMVISSALETVRLAAQAKSLQIQTVLPSDVGAVMGDAGRLQQIVWNLLSNAVKFTPLGGQVTVALTQMETHAQIQVMDTGKGINPDFLPYVFEHFRQEDGATTRKFGGLGLGLAIARQIVEMHGGQIGVDSSGEGQGATFTVELPLAPTLRRLPSTESSDASTNDLNGIRILVVDDEPDSRDFITFVLELSGASVTSVASGIEALTAIKQFIPDLIISDIGMPDMDGYMLMQQIRSRPANQGGTIRAIALTAYAAEIDQQRTRMVGFQAHITKPVEPEKLVRAIAHLLERN
jgi:PAS domain S-box-containing protein